MRSVSQPKYRTGFSLLEVMLALSILGVSAAILAQIMQIGSDNGLRARLITQAQMLCESKMNEIVLSSTTTQSATWTPLTLGDANAEWFFQIQNISAEQKSLVGVVVSISDAESIKQNGKPLARLVQWIVDPSLNLDKKPTIDNSGTNLSSSSSSASSGSSSGGVQ